MASDNNVPNPENRLTPHSISRDGKYLAYMEAGGDTHYDIWTLPIDWRDPEHPKAGKPEVFLRTPANEGEPAFSPDGRWLAYTANEGPNYEVYVRPFPANARGGKWQVSSGGGTYPVWSQKGNELFYQAQDRIMVATYTVRGDSFTADKPRVWSEAKLARPTTLAMRRFDVAPDGRRVAALAPVAASDAQQTPNHVIFLENFFDELRRRVPVSK